jgi:hypothetical protein
MGAVQAATQLLSSSQDAKIALCCEREGNMYCIAVEGGALQGLCPAC